MEQDLDVQRELESEQEVLDNRGAMTENRYSICGWSRVSLCVFKSYVHVTRVYLVWHYDCPPKREISKHFPRSFMGTVVISVAASMHITALFDY